MLTRRLAAGTLAGLALCVASTVPAAATAPTAQPKSAAHPAAAPVVANGAWTVYHHDNGHTGYDSTLPAVTGASTGWVTTALDGSIYAEPLVFNGIVYAATLQGTLYAINQADGIGIWSTNVGTPQSVLSGQCGNISPLGISGTPVIDTAAGRIYVAEILAADKLWHVFGIDLSTHAIVMNTAIPSSLGTGFDWTIEQERGALGLANGYVYVPFGGRAGDCGAYHGWIFAVPTNGAAVTNFYETPGQGAGFWTAGGVVIDNSTGKVFETSGNGTAGGCNANSNGTPTYENDAVVRLSSTLAHEDAFIPQDWRGNWCINDQDLGSASMVLISPTLAFQAGKWGNGFLVNPQALGGMDGQLYPTPKPATYSSVDVCLGNHSDANFGSYAYAAPYVYLSCEGNGLVALQVNTSTPSFSSCDATCAGPSWNAGGFSPGPPIVAGGAVWAVDTGGGGLFGFNASTGAPIFQSAGFGVTHFTTPSEAGGQIFVGSGNVVREFSLTINVCASVTASASPPTPQAPGTPVTITALATGCPMPLYQFWMLTPGSSTWTIAQAYSTMATFNWTTTGKPPGIYHFSVWARDSSSAGTSCNSLGCNDAFVPGFAYTLSSTACTSVTATPAPSPASPQALGTTITITGSASGCGSTPLYQFWILNPGSSTWAIAQAYSSTATFSWTSQPFSGTYHFSIWARDTNSTGTSCNSLGCSDAFVPGFAYTLTSASSTPCTSVTATPAPSPASPQASGTAITISGSAAGCTNPRYQFWVLAPGGTWTIGQAYSNSATFNWLTTGKAAGTYYISIWARDAGSPGTSCSSLGCSDAFVPGFKYTLTSTPCASVTASAVPTSTATRGTTVVITGNASGCPNALYQFWILAPGSTTWTIGQAYSNSATFNWNTTGLAAGTWRYSVWARDASSSGTTSTSLGTFDAFVPGTTYTLT